MEPRIPRGVWVPAVFFVFSGLSDLGAALYETRPLQFWPIWDAFFRSLLHVALAWGLLRRIALCRSIAMIYCLAMLSTYAVVLGLALMHAPGVAFPASVKFQSLIQVPSCALLLPYLRSPRASELYPKPLFGR